MTGRANFHSYSSASSAAAEEGEGNKCRTYYEVLGLDHNRRAEIDSKSIRRAYLSASLAHHPDKNPHDPEGAQRRFVEVGQAYEVLSDPDKRREYDRELLVSGGWRRRQANDAASAAGGEGGSSKARAAGASSFASYRDKFDSFVAGMTEEELNAAMGAAAAVGSVVGSVVGSLATAKSRGGGRNKTSSASAVGSAVSTAASVAASAAASRAAADLVRTVHERSVERATYEELKRAAVERGEEPPPPPEKSASAKGGVGGSRVRESIGRVAEAVARSVMEGSGSSDSASRGEAGGNRSEKWKNVLGVAVQVAETLAAINEAKGARNRS